GSKRIRGRRVGLRHRSRWLEADRERVRRGGIAAEGLLSMRALGGQQVLEPAVRLLGGNLRLVLVALHRVHGQARSRARISLRTQEHTAECNRSVAVDLRAQRQFLAFGQRTRGLLMLDEGWPCLARDLRRWMRF